MRIPHIATLVPQQGAMCLLDEILSFDERTVVCSTMSHRSLGNPLRCDGRLPAMAGVEYGAQAAAVHGGLREEQSEPNGLLAGVRVLRCPARYLDDVSGPLTVQAELLFIEGNRMLYTFVVKGAEFELVGGRIAVVLGTGRMR